MVNFYHCLFKEYLRPNLCEKFTLVVNLSVHIHLNYRNYHIENESDQRIWYNLMNA